MLVVYTDVWYIVAFKWILAETAVLLRGGSIKSWATNESLYESPGKFESAERRGRSRCSARPTEPSEWANATASLATGAGVGLCLSTADSHGFLIAGTAGGGCSGQMNLSIALILGKYAPKQKNATLVIDEDDLGWKCGHIWVFSSMNSTQFDWTKSVKCLISIFGRFLNNNTLHGLHLFIAQEFHKDNDKLIYPVME